MPELTFVVLSDRSSTSRRSKELRDASARSHAARVSHRRSKLRKQLSSPTASDKSCPCRRSESPRVKIEDDEADAAVQRSSNRSPAQPLDAKPISLCLPNVLGGGKRDPFTSHPGADLPSFIHDALHFRKLNPLRSSVAAPSASVLAIAYNTA